jgi:hypothetical protein
MRVHRSPLTKSEFIVVLKTNNVRDTHDVVVAP